MIIAQEIRKVKTMDAKVVSDEVIGLFFVSCGRPERQAKAKTVTDVTAPGLKPHYTWK